MDKKMDKKNKIIAEALGYKLSQGEWRKPMDPKLNRLAFKFICKEEDWQPYSNINQVDAFVAPALSKIGWTVDYKENFALNQVVVSKGDKRYAKKGKGKTPPNRLAWAACEIFVKIKKIKWLEKLMRVTKPLDKDTLFFLN